MGRAEDFEAMAAEALHDYCLRTNPRSVSQAQIVQVYQHAMTR